MQRLNLGCGSDIRAGWINLDRTALPSVDVVHDLNQLPLPFESSSFDQVAARDVLEHVEYVPLLRDICRVLRSGGRLDIQVPHFTAANNFIDPTHRHRFSIRTFEFFVPDSEFGRDYYFDFSFHAIAVRRIRFLKWPLVYNYFVEALVNSHRVVQKYYELTMLAALFPATNITVTLVK
jgi:SAM-dependent methyltransferase